MHFISHIFLATKRSFNCDHETGVLEILFCSGVGNQLDSVMSWQMYDGFVKRFMLEDDAESAEKHRIDVRKEIIGKIP